MGVFDVGGAFVAPVATVATGFVSPFAYPSLTLGIALASGAVSAAGGAGWVGSFVTTGAALAAGGGAEGAAARPVAALAVGA